MNIGDLEEYQVLVQEMLSKVSTEGPSEPMGTPFPSINGPLSQDTSIGVVGAGLAGVHMAYSLKKAGFRYKRNLKISSTKATKFLMLYNSLV